MPIMTITHPTDCKQEREITRVESKMPELSELRKLSDRSIQAQDKWPIFSGVMGHPKPSEFFLQLDQKDQTENEQLSQWFPELLAGKDMSQNRFHKYDVYYHSLYTCDAAPADNLKLRLAALLHDLGKVPSKKIDANGEPTFHNHEILSVHIGRRILTRMGAPRKLMREILFLVRHHMFYYTDDWTDRAVRRFLKKVNEQQLEDLILLRIADRIGSGKRKSLPKEIYSLKNHIEHIKKIDSAFKIKDLAINGHDLMQLGIPAGPSMGQILAKLMEEVTKGKLENSHEALRAQAKEYNNLEHTKSNRQ